MAQSIYFNAWISRHPGLARGFLILILFAGIAQFASFAVIQAHVISFYGAQPEDISFALQISYAGIIATLPLQFRMVRYFNTRSYLLTAFLAGILLNIGLFSVHDIVLFSVLRFFTGVVTCIIAGCMLIVIFTTIPEPKRMLVGISLFFSLILTSGLIVGLGTAWVVMRMDWTEVYYGLIALQVMAILLCLLIFKPKPAFKPYPLYQTDWYGSFLFMFAAVATAFVMIYGPRQYWFADSLIRYTAVFAAALFALFLFRQATLKRPLIDLRVFRSGKFIFALLLMVLFFGMKDSINLVYGYSVLALGWSASDVVNSGLYNIAGAFIGTFIAAKVILAKKQNLPLLLLAGFAVLFYYHVWVYAHLTPSLSLAELRIPIFLQGFGSGLLFVPITVFCVVSVPQSTGMTAIVICAYARFIAVLNSIAGFYTMQLSYNRQFKDNLQGKLIPENDIFLQRLELYKGLFVSRGYTPGEATGISNMLITKSSALQSQLLTIRAIFLVGAILMAAAFLVLIAFAVVNKIKAAGNKKKMAMA
ncbi:MFS transporter [Chitinophaga barathri]|uniref:MFS transporter n=1 Tax=Chitinophaga barathri TaxID=1647451 RepID=A0A3N4MD59_9BACT|nr:MFS transporter [Chitinophaga barathri]RPD41498.1 MFS transporter [Chitinophaga barathri]